MRLLISLHLLKLQINFSNTSNTRTGTSSKCDHPSDFENNKLFTLGIYVSTKINLQICNSYLRNSTVENLHQHYFQTLCTGKKIIVYNFILKSCWHMKLFTYREFLQKVHFSSTFGISASLFTHSTTLKLFDNRNRVNNNLIYEYLYRFPMAKYYSTEKIRQLQIFFVFYAFFHPLPLNTPDKKNKNFWNRFS